MQVHSSWKKREEQASTFFPEEEKKKHPSPVAGVPYCTLGEEDQP